MKQNFIFVFVLLATLLMVNAVPHQLQKRATKFNDCPIKGIATLSATVSPDPVAAPGTASFSVFGTLKNDVTPGTTVLAIDFADETGKQILLPVYFQIFNEAFTAGSTVSIEAQNVPVPNSFPAVYTIGIGIGNPNLGDPVNPIDLFGCTYAVVGKSSASADFSLAGITGA